MADVIWRGGALAVAQVDTLTIGGTLEVGDKFNVIIGAKTFTYVAATTTIATERTSFVTAWNALSTTLYPEFQEITASAGTGSGDINLTADTAGVPFTVTLTTTESDDSAADLQTFLRAATTANSGPKAFGTAANWSTGIVPVTTDNVYFEDSDNDCLYGLDQSGKTFALVRVSASYIGKLGLPEENSGGYDEYRDTYLKAGMTIVDIGRGDGNGSARIKLDLGASSSAITVHASATGENDLPAIQLKGTHVTNTLTALGGSVGVAIFGGETSTFATLKSTGANLRCGPGVTLTTVQHAGAGTLQIESACTTINKEAGSGTMKVLGTGAVTTINCWGGVLAYHSTGTITTLNVAGTVDFDINPAARIVTNCTLYKGCHVKNKANSVTWTNGYLLSGCLRIDADVDNGPNRTERVT